MCPEHYSLIFVFGSNEAGIHGKGAALHAKEWHGAIQGMYFGRQGSSFAIPTKDRNLKTLPLDTIELYVNDFLRYAWEHLNEAFVVTRVGCGLAGYTDEDIAPMFDAVPVNCSMPPEWADLLMLPDED